MQLDQPTDKRQAEAQAVGACVAASAAPNEQVEDLGQQGGRNPATGVAHPQHRLDAVPMHADDDATSARGIAERVVQEVRDDLFESRRVPDHPD